MAVLEDLHKSISEMSDPELEELFRLSRLTRRTAKSQMGRKKKATKVKSSVKKVAVLKPVDGMSANAAAEMLKALGVTE